MPSRMPREQGWPPQAPPASREAARPHCRTRCGGMNAAGQAGCETMASCPRKILGAGWARSGHPLKLGRMRNHRLTLSGCNSCFTAVSQPFVSDGLSGILRHRPNGRDEGPWVSALHPLPRRVRPRLNGRGHVTRQNRLTPSVRSVTFPYCLGMSPTRGGRKNRCLSPFGAEPVLSASWPCASPKGMTLEGFTWWTRAPPSVLRRMV
jgi:hypothetical protein